MNKLKNNKKGHLTALFFVLALSSTYALALDNQWYIGAGGTVGWLQPNPEQIGLHVEEEQGTGGHLILGRDLDDRSSTQLQVYSLGEAELENGELVPYAAVDGSIAYRFYDSRDKQLALNSFGMALYGRFALGYLNRDTEVVLDSGKSGVYFGAGGGAEMFFNRHFSLRLEGLYHDSDASSANLSIITRFGGRPAVNQPIVPTPPAFPTLNHPPSAPIPSQPEQPMPEQLPQNNPDEVTLPPMPTTLELDGDGDGVLDNVDQCLNSRTGYPVRDTGCPLFDGVLSGVNFVESTAKLTAEASIQLDYLAKVMAKYPMAQIELMAHTDSMGTIQEQAVLTRARLRSLGSYLVGRGVSAKRMVLRSFGGAMPLYDNTLIQGRQGNNRIEVAEPRR